MKNLDLLLSQLPSPLQKLESELFVGQGVSLFLKRDDLLHPHVSGNKWRKLKYNLLEAHRLGVGRVVTFGGAYSNHLAAVAAAGELFGLETIGIVRGKEGVGNSHTLQYSESCGMRLEFVSRADFGQEKKESLLANLDIDTNGTLVIPEGGVNCHALAGCREIVEETAAQLGGMPDYFVTACGTGATLAGLASGINGLSIALGIAVLKGGFLQNNVQALLNNCSYELANNWQVIDGFHFGGYAKWKSNLIDFINTFKNEHGVPLDPIYTGKAMFAVHELAGQGYFPRGSSIVFVHTGGLQGIVGFNDRFGLLIK